MSKIKIERLHKLETDQQMWRRYKREIAKFKRAHKDEPSRKFRTR